MSDFFKKELPLTGGNSKTIKELIDVVDNNINYTTGKISSNVKKYAASEGFTYSLWWLLHLQADYFSNLVDFQFYNWETNRQVCIAIKLAIIYGSAVLWRNGNNIVAMYVNTLELDEWGKPKKVKMYRADYVLLSQSVDLNKAKINWIEREIDDNIIVFQPNNYNIGGIVKWLPFLKQFERLLKMLYTKAFSYVKSIIYNVKDPNFIDKEIELYFSAENPFLINTSDDVLISNKFKEMEVSNNTSGDGLINYIKEFINIYYDLIGRRYNSDKKRERNISDEVNATQENYDILQREIVNNIIYLCRELFNRWGQKFRLNGKEV